MKVYGKIKNEKIIFLALESELPKEELLEYDWQLLGQANEIDYAAVVNGTWLGKPLFDENGIANYKISSDSFVERTLIEKQAELANRPPVQPSLQEQIDALSNAVLTLMMGGISNV